MRVLNDDNADNVELLRLVKEELVVATLPDNDTMSFAIVL